MIEAYLAHEAERKAQEHYDAWKKSRKKNQGKATEAAAPAGGGRSAA